MIHSKSWGLLLLLLWAGSMLNALMQDSAFMPPVRSLMKSSLIARNPWHEHYASRLRDEGLTHPFESSQGFLRHLKSALLIDDEDVNLLSYRDQESGFGADLKVLAGYEHSFIDDEDYQFWYKGLDLKASAGKRLHLFSRWYNGAFYGNLDAAEEDPLVDGYFKRFNQRIQLDNVNGAISYDAENYSLALGRGTFQISPSVSGSIILSDRVNDYAYFLAEGRAGAFSFSFLHGSLMADSTYSTMQNNIVNDRNYPDKFIALHQMNYRPNQAWDLYLGESVIYGNRSIDLNYILPNSFWRAVEHNLWDRDNVLIYGGIIHRMNPGLTLYGQVAIDEFSYGKVFSNWWGNKYALQSGIAYTTVNSSTNLEITAVRPYTYAHFQNHTMYSHDGRPLGYPLGSNVANITMEHYQVFNDFLDGAINLSYSYRGSEGSDWRENYHDVFAGQIDDAKVKWFAGDKTSEYTITSCLGLNLFWHHELLLGYQGKYLEDWQHKVSGCWQFKF